MNNQIILTSVPLDDLIHSLRNQMIDVLQAQLNGVSQTPKSVLYDRPITEKELCGHFRISAPTAIRWRSKGKIPYMAIGSAIRYNLADVEKALQTQKSNKV